MCGIDGEHNSASLGHIDQMTYHSKSLHKRFWSKSAQNILHFCIVTIPSLGIVM
jgi:hypothetical protein